MQLHLIAGLVLVAIVTAVVFSTNFSVRSSGKTVQNTLKSVKELNAHFSRTHDEMVQDNERDESQKEKLDREEALCRQNGGSYDRATRMCNPLHACRVVNEGEQLTGEGWQAGTALKRSFNSECILMKEGKSCKKGKPYEGSWLKDSSELVKGLSPETYGDCFGEHNKTDAYIGYAENGSATENEDSSQSKYMRVIDRAYKNVDTPCQIMKAGDKLPNGVWSEGMRFRLHGYNNSCYEMRKGASCASNNFGDCYREATQPSSAWKYIEVRPQGCAASDQFKKDGVYTWGKDHVQYKPSRRWLPGERWMKSDGNNKPVCAANKSEEKLRCMDLDECFQRAGVGGNKLTPLCSKVQSVSL